MTLVILTLGMAVVGYFLGNTLSGYDIPPRGTKEFKVQLSLFILSRLLLYIGAFCFGFSLALLSQQGKQT